MARWGAACVVCSGQRVIDDEICFRKNDFLELSQVFRDRMTMHQRVYTHKKAKAIEYMVVDAMREADHVLPHDEKYSQVRESSPHFHFPASPIQGRKDD